METLYAIMIMSFGQTKVDNFCENAFWRTDINTHTQIVELCAEDVWKKTFQDAYIETK